MYGLTVEVPFVCRSLRTAAAPPGVPADVVVREAPVPRGLAEPQIVDRLREVAPAQMLVRGGPRGGRWRVIGRDRVELQRGPQAEEVRLESLLLNQVLPSVLWHRRLLVLHATAAVTPAGAVAVAGVSGAGKSTTLGGLLARGCTMVTDDVTVIDGSATGAPWVRLGFPRLQLGEESAGAVGRSVEGLARPLWRRGKASVPADDEMALGPVELGAVYVLGTGSADVVVTRRLEGREKFDALLDCLYGPVLPSEHSQVFAAMSALADRVPITRLQRPKGRWSLDEVVDTILGARGPALAGGTP